MQYEASMAGITWLYLLIIAGWGGLVRFLMDVKQGKAKWSWINAFAQIVVSACTGVIGGLISIECSLSIYMLLATACIS
ncbi:phage holin family protein, partial [Klebsiella pneumoniae]|uniref:phage holin family protein n=1 Tax=Klebsiella pneumoniae TaxID=573 RepID=UPI0027309F5F